MIVTILSLYDTICYALNFYDPYILNNKVNLYFPIVQLIFFLLMLIILKKENRYFKIAFIFGILYAVFFVLKTILGVTSLHDIVFASFYFLTYSINSVLISLLYFTTYIFFIIGMLKTSFLNKIKSILIFYLVAFGVSRVLNLISRVFNDIISNPYLDETRSISRVLLMMSLFVAVVYLIAKLIFCIKIITISKAKIRDSNQENYIDNAN